MADKDDFPFPDIEPSPEDLYQRVEETGFATFEDLEEHKATRKEWLFCNTCQMVTIHRDHLDHLLPNADKDYFCCIICAVNFLRGR